MLAFVRSPTRWVLLAAIAATAVAGASSIALAEGEAELGGAQPLKKPTAMNIDILEVGETVTWTGVGQLELSDASGTLIESLSTGETSAPIPFVGTVKAAVTENQRQTVGIDFYVPVGWDIEVQRAGVEQLGRLHSKRWIFETGAFTEDRAANASVYALTPGGVPGSDVVIEMRLDGINGVEYQITANRTGLAGDDAGTSVPDPNSSKTVPIEYDIYLNVPAKAQYNAATPTVSDLTFSGDVAGCQTTIAPSVNSFFQFSTNVDGTYHLGCDLNGDGVYNTIGSEDLLLIGRTLPNTVNTVAWDGTNNGVPVASGTYDCRVSVHVGEFHFAARDVETCFAGLRMFEVAADGSRSGLPMFWNDEKVQANAVPMPPSNGQVLQSPATSPQAGLSSGAYSDPTVVYGLLSPFNAMPPTFRPGNSRAWGAFRGATFDMISKGDMAVLDTYTWARASDSGNIAITVITDQDTDLDGCSDLKEICSMGSDFEVVDTDADGLGDCAEFEFNPNPTSPIDPDTDGDGLCDGAVAVQNSIGVDVCIPGEDNDTDGMPSTDPDGTPIETNPADEDTDDDGFCDGPLVPTPSQCDEPSDNCPLVFNPDQADGDNDGIGDACDPLDCDPDKDGIPDVADPECWPDGPPDGPCMGGSIANCIDNCTELDNPDQADQDGDGIGDACDCDKDGDGIIDGESPDCWGGEQPPESCTGGETVDCRDNCPDTSNPDQADGDGDGIGDACECDRDGDGVIDSSAIECWPFLPPGTDPPTEPCADGDTSLCLDNCPDDPNADQLDTDGDGEGDACECDRDGDGVIDSPAAECWPGQDPPTESCVDGETEDCLDNCPVTPNADQSDLDGDGEGDACECDKDGDGIIDSSLRICWPDVPPNEQPPSDPCEDGQTQDCIDNCPETPNPGQQDSDGNGIGDACECDRDGDGIIDNGAAICWPGEEPPTEPCTGGETEDCLDNCPDTANPGQEDSDNDGQGDACECDRDGDGVIDNPALVCWPDLPPGEEPPTEPCADGQTDDCLDNCPDTANGDQDDFDGDGIGDDCDCDVDGDTVVDSTSPDCWPGGDVPNDTCDEDETQDCIDNCPRTPNTDQADLDNDGVGDDCDPDIDGDGLLNTEEDLNGNGEVDPTETDPRDPDTDDGGETDGEEVNNNRNPLLACDDFGGSCRTLVQGGGCAGGGDSPAPWVLMLGLAGIAVARRRTSGNR